MNDARQQMLERIGEDESLTGDLAGAAADAVRQWANDTAVAIAGRDDLDDATVQQHIRAVRTAARTAASHDGDLALAQRELAQLLAQPLNPAVVVAPDQTVLADAAPMNQTESHHANTHQPVLLRIRGWWRGIWSRESKEE